MKLQQHPEYTLYQEHRAQAARYRRAVAAWPDDSDTRTEAEAVLAELLPLLQTYNLILWHHFPYCRDCLGGCCVAGATDLRPVDYVALALLEEALPPLKAHTGRDKRACIYLTPSGCSWPSRWRPLKCALFYCLGSGAIAIDASDARYGELTAALEEALAPRLDRLLPDDAGTLLPLLPDPVAFAGALAEILAQKLLFPLYELAPDLLPAANEGREREDHPDAEVLSFIAAATEQLWTDSTVPPPGPDLTVEQLLADLETLEWLIQGTPATAADVLAEMAGRYPAAAGDTASIWQEMAKQIMTLRASFSRQAR